MEYIWDPILSEADKTFVRLDFFPPLPTCEVKAPVLSVIWSANVRSIKINSGSSIHMKLLYDETQNNNFLLHCIAFS